MAGNCIDWMGRYPFFIHWEQWGCHKHLHRNCPTDQTSTAYTRDRHNDLPRESVLPFFQQVLGRFSDHFDGEDQVCVTRSLTSAICSALNGSHYLYMISQCQCQGPALHHHDHYEHLSRSSFIMNHLCWPPHAPLVLVNFPLCYCIHD